MNDLNLDFRVRVRNSTAYKNRMEILARKQFAIIVMCQKCQRFYRVCCCLHCFVFHLLEFTENGCVCVCVSVSGLNVDSLHLLLRFELNKPKIIIRDKLM